jgi:PAS domain S-box-containing protein
VVASGRSAIAGHPTPDWPLLTVSPIRDADGAVIGASSITRDVTEARQAYEAARSMIESSLDSLVAISPEGLITDANEALVKATGIPRQDLIGTTFSDCLTEPEKAEKIYQLVFAEGMAVDYPLTLRHRDGTLTEVLYNASVYRDAGGKILGVFATARDVTKARQAYEAARSMIESSLDSLVAISPEGLITDANEAWSRPPGSPGTNSSGPRSLTVSPNRRRPRRSTIWSSPRGWPWTTR